MIVMWRKRTIDGRVHFECPVIYRPKMDEIAKRDPAAPVPVVPGASIFGGKGSRKEVTRMDRTELKEFVEEWLIQ